MSNEVISECFFENYKNHLDNALALKEYTTINNIFKLKKDEILKHLNAYNLTYNPILKLNLYNEKEKENLIVIEKIITNYNLYKDKDFCNKITSLDYNEARGIYAELVFIKQIKSNKNAIIKLIEKSKVKTNDFEIQFKNETYNIEITTNLMGKAEKNIREGFREFIEYLRKEPELDNTEITLEVKTDEFFKKKNINKDTVLKILKKDFKIIKNLILKKDGNFNLKILKKQDYKILKIDEKDQNTLNNLSIEGGYSKNEPNQTRFITIKTINKSPSSTENNRIEYVLCRFIEKIKYKINDEQLKNKTNAILVITSDDHIFESDFNNVIQQPCFTLCVKKLIENTNLLGVYIYQENIIDGSFISNNQDKAIINKITTLFKK